MIDPDEIGRQADKERKKAQQKAKLEQADKDADNAPYKYNSFYVYRKIFPSKFNPFKWLLILGVPGAMAVIIYFLDEDISSWVLNTGLASLGLLILLNVIHFLRKVFTYNTYKNFIKELPFPLVGWEKLGANPKLFIDVTHWANDSYVEVIMKDKSGSLHIKLIKDALFLFSKDANSHFYETVWGKMESSHWKFEHALKIKGDANQEVVGDMYHLINVYLKSIQQQHACIESVKVFINAEVGKIDPTPYTD